MRNINIYLLLLLLLLLFDIIVTLKQEIKATMVVKKVVWYYFPIAVISKRKSFDPCKSKRFYCKFDVNHP